jgi:DNA-directed RNA polymerase specialized sigma24 family protein
MKGGIREELVREIPRRMSGVASLVDPEDLAQEAFLAMVEAHGPEVDFTLEALIKYAFWRGSDTLETAGTDALARGALRGITRWEKDRGVTALPPPNSSLPDDLSCPHPSPEDEAIASDTLSGLMDCMDEWFRKPAKRARQKEILLRLVAGMGKKEIAGIMGVRPCRAGTLITETRAACRATLGLPSYAEGTLGRRGDRYTAA